MGPMDQFQRDFFLLRQAEYLPYCESLGPGLVQQGMLSDPAYFDFISFAQYATISREINNNPPAVFEESQPVDVGPDKPMKFVPVIVRRNSDLLDNSLLPLEHERIVGNAILDHFEAKLGQTSAALPVLSNRPDNQTILAGLQQLVKIFLINGFAFDGSAASAGSQFSLTLISPSTLWSGQVLKLRRAKPANDFILKAARIYLQRAGYSI